MLVTGGNTVYRFQSLWPLWPLILPARWTVPCCFTYHKYLKGQNDKNIHGRKAKHWHDPHVSLDVKSKVT